MDTTFARALTPLLWVALSLVATSADAQPVDRAHILFSADVGGAFATPVCSGERTLVASSFGRYGARLLEERGRDPSALIVDTGDLLAPHGVTRFAASSVPDATAAMIHDLGYHALTLGSSELAAPRESMIALIAALRRKGIPMIASNLFCDDDVGALCDGLVDGSDGVPSFEVDQEKIAVLAFLGEGTLDQVAETHRKGLRIVPVGEALPTAVQRARAAGASLVVTIVHGRSDDGLSSIAKLVGELPEDGKPDLLLASEGGDEILFARPRGRRPAIAAAASGEIVDVSLRQEDDRLDIVARPLTPSDGKVDAIETFIQAVGTSYCERWGSPLAGAEIGKKALDGPGLLELSAAIVRDRTHTEIVLLNRGVADGGFSAPSGHALTASDIYLALHYDEEIVVADVEAAWIEKLASKLDEKRLLALGIEVTGAGTPKVKVKINGKALDGDLRYRVATLRFLATGGDGLLPEGPQWKSVHRSLREEVLAYLGEERKGDPRDSLRDPSERFEWTLRTQLDATFAASVSNNPAGYDASQLDRAETTTFGVELKLDGGATSKHLGWENTLEARYSSIRAAGGNFDEGTDLLSYRTNIRYRGLRSMWSRPYVPEPFFEAYVESEFTKPDDRGYHHLLTRPTAGLRFTFTKHLSLKVAGGGEVELLDPNGRFDWGLGGSLELKPWALLVDRALHRKLELSFLLDYFVARPGTLNRQTLRGRLDTSFALNRHLSLALLVELFGMKERGAELGVAASTTAALRARWSGRSLAR